MAITQLPSPSPTRDMSSDVYVSAMNAWIAALPQMLLEINAALLSIDTSVLSCSQSAASAFISASTATAAANASLLSANVVLWVSGTSYSQGIVVSSPANAQTYRKKTTTNTLATTDPSANGADWQILTGSFAILSSRTSNTTLVGTDFAKIIDITSGTFTQTFTAAATLGSGWFIYLRNSGTGDITLDPNGSETIDGLTSYIMYPGEVRLIQCNGSAFISLVLQGFVKTFTTTATFIKPPGYNTFSIISLAGGGGGGSGTKASAGNNHCGGAGGGPGGRGTIELPASIIGATETVTIGAGGAGGASQTVDSTAGIGGTNGGNTLFGTWFKVQGGALGGGGVTNSSGTGGLAGMGYPDYSGLSDADGFGLTKGSKGGDSAYTGGTASQGSALAPTGGSPGGGSSTPTAGLAAGAVVGSSVGLTSTLAGGVAGTIGGGVGGNGNTLTNMTGTGGGGGGGNSSGNGGNGGIGGLGAGGGGGGCAINSLGNSGAGGAGGDGQLTISGR